MAESYFLESSYFSRYAATNLQMISLVLSPLSEPLPVRLSEFILSPGTPGGKKLMNSQCGAHLVQRVIGCWHFKKKKKTLSTSPHPLFFFLILFPKTVYLVFEVHWLLLQVFSRENRLIGEVPNSSQGEWIRKMRVFPVCGGFLWFTTCIYSVHFQLSLC